MAKPYNNPIPRERLLEVLNYDQETGVFLWRINPGSGVRAGNRAGSVYSNGYRYIQIDGVPYRACRLAWLYVKGEPVPDEIDHRSTIKSDDRIGNLRKSTTSQNQANRNPLKSNTSGVKGVSWQPTRNRWIAMITVQGKAKNLGRFRTKEEAAEAYRVAAIAAFGEFSRTGDEE